MKSWLAVVVLYALVNPNLLPAREATPAKILSRRIGIPFFPSPIFPYKYPQFSPADILE